MEFIVDNYIWFVIGGVILLMALVGYIAEKTDFGRKQFEKKIKVEKSKPEKKRKVVDKNEQPIETTPLVDLDFDEVETEDLNTPLINDEYNNEEILKNDELEVPIEEDLNASLEDFEQSMDEDLSAPLESFGQPIEEDLNAPLENFEQPMDEDLTTPLIDESKEDSVVEDVIIEEPFKEIDTTTPVFQEEKNDDIVLPDIESLKKDDVEDEDDVWKF